MSSIKAQAVVVGASAGALDALTAILPKLPREFRLPVMVVVHVPPDKRSILAELFQAKCSLLVQEAEDKEPLSGGAIYFAPPDYHLLVEADGYLSLSNEEPILFSRPSIDVLFDSAADAYGEGLIAVLLTGANEDGAQGMRSVIAAGGTGIVQDPQTAFAAAMPKAAIKICPMVQVMPLESIAAFLQQV